eukprot:TRINITY_DN6035_c1_g2_i1.p1 TRINITY_DN6035_c1_g2~~TRINITY_DN6035_c1_g2_i1.p1  ORF type:complete len:565 (+),score=187.50 TRINITY_DN6035_c1_g2_i1:65-1759(+)
MGCCCVKVRQATSNSRRRYQDDGFDLDLTYISAAHVDRQGRRRLIAMGFPAQGVAQVWRNRYLDVRKLFLKRHPRSVRSGGGAPPRRPGAARGTTVRVYNLCIEQEHQYDDPRMWGGQWEAYPMYDHNPAALDAAVRFCDSVHVYLAQDARNVAAVHCKAGKGRTGTMLACYMVHAACAGAPPSASLLASPAALAAAFEDCAARSLARYAKCRTRNGRGVTIASQRRMVGYYARLLATAWRARAGGGGAAAAAPRSPAAEHDEEWSPRHRHADVLPEFLLSPVGSTPSAQTPSTIPAAEALAPLLHCDDDEDGGGGDGAAGMGSRAHSMATLPRHPSDSSLVAANPLDDGALGVAGAKTPPRRPRRRARCAAKVHDRHRATRESLGGLSSAVSLTELAGTEWSEEEGGSEEEEEEEAEAGALAPSELLQCLRSEQYWGRPVVINRVVVTGCSEKRLLFAMHRNTFDVGAPPTLVTHSRGAAEGALGDAPVRDQHVFHVGCVVRGHVRFTVLKANKAPVFSLWCYPVAEAGRAHYDSHQLDWRVERGKRRDGVAVVMHTDADGCV